MAPLPMNAPDAIVPEVDRAMRQLGAAGVPTYSTVNGRPLDRPGSCPLFERMAGVDLPIWVHPARTRGESGLC